MRDYLRSLAQHFDNTSHLARFLGVSFDTVRAWKCGRREPRASTLRLLEVLGLLALESPALLEALAKASSTKPAPREFRVRLPELPAVPEPVKMAPRVAVWSDDFWTIRTVTREELDEGIWPSVRDGASYFNAMTEAREAAYWDALCEFERRTGRVRPD